MRGDPRRTERGTGRRAGAGGEGWRGFQGGAPPPPRDSSRAAVQVFRGAPPVGAGPGHPHRRSRGVWGSCSRPRPREEIASKKVEDALERWLAPPDRAASESGE